MLWLEVNHHSSKSDQAMVLVVHQEQFQNGFFFIFILFYFSNVSISSTERKLLNDSLLISFFKPIFEDLKTFKKYF